MTLKKITLCGDDCFACPRYLAKTDSELKKVAELWYKIGWRDHIVSNQEIQCFGCSPQKECTYHLVDCTKDHGVNQCNACSQFPCTRIDAMLKRSLEYEKTCKEVCTDAEYQALKKAFFQKEKNLENERTEETEGFFNVAVDVNDL